jgi:hypothetical protein
LAVATFVKAVGVGFLAKPRSDAAARAVESPPSMVAGMALSGVAALVLALAPMLVLPTIGRLAAGLSGAGRSSVSGSVTIRLTAFAGSVSPLLLFAGVLVGAVVTVALVRMLATQRVRRAARLWDCGGGPLSARMEYTATSFAEPLQRVFDNVVRPETDVDVSHYEESRYLVSAVAFRRRVPDRIERCLYQPVLSAMNAWGRVGRVLATGSVHRYLGYGFYTVIALLLALAVTR